MSEKKKSSHCKFETHRLCRGCACPCHSAVIHELKTWPEYYQAIINCAKPFEVRKDDRGFEVDHVLRLREYDPKTKSYTGKQCHRRVTYILRGGAFGVEAGYCVMGIMPL